MIRPRVLSAIVLFIGLLAVPVVEASAETIRRTPPDYVAKVLADLSTAKDHVEPNSPVLEKIAAGDQQAARDMLSFRPRAEAPVPEGFPKFTPVGVIEVKRYPAYRKAVGPAFMPLFNHIQKQSIPMTAPVEMTGEMTDSPENPGDGPMAFLYQNTEVGQLGPIDGIDVEQTPATTVVSLGNRGQMTKQRVNEAKKRLEAWLAAQKKYREASGESFRLFGYSSPMIPDTQQYWEAQLLLKPAEKIDP